MKRTVRESRTIPTEELRVFERVARLRGITAAAGALNLSKSVVSKLISRLEARLGVQLLERSSRRVELTEAGKVLVVRAESLLGEITQLTDDMRELNAQVRGQLTIAAPPDLGAHLAGGFFPAFRAAHPSVSLSLRLDYAYADLFDPTLDLAFRIKHVRDERLVARVVGSIRHVAVAGLAFARAHKLRSPLDLPRVPTVTSFDTDHGIWQLTDGVKRVEIEVTGALRTRSYPALARAAEAGVGVALLPEFMVQRAIEAGWLVRVLPRWSTPSHPLFLVHRPGHHRVRRVAAMLDFVRTSKGLLPEG